MGRDRYTQDVACSECGTAGTFKLSEGDGAFSGGEATIDRTPEGFTVIGSPRFYSDLRIKCADCEAIVHETVKPPPPPPVLKKTRPKSG